MDLSLIENLRVLWPVILGLLIFLLQFCVSRSTELDIDFRLPFLKSLGFKMRGVRVIFVRILLAVATIICFIIPAFRDYSKLFPENFKMVVFYDDEGIKEALSEFTEDELNALRVKTDWDAEKAEYFSFLNKETKKFDILFLFDVDNNIVHGEGRTHFKVTRVKNSWQEYQIDKSTKGTLEHMYEAPGEKQRKLISEFQLLESDANRIKPTLADLYLKYTIILTPRFKQKVNISPMQEVYHHYLIAATKIRFFPIIRIGKTIYLLCRDGSKEVIPIGYAIYSPE